VLTPRETAKLGLHADEADHRRVLAVVQYLRSGRDQRGTSDLWEP
jgi:hypothetical protein